MHEGLVHPRKDTLPEAVEKMRERIFGPRSIELGKDAKFLISVSREEASVELLKDGVDILRVRELLPENVSIRFNLKDQWNVDFTDAQHPIIHIGKMIGIHDVLLFMHETMHARNAEDSMIALEAKERYAEELSHDAVSALPERRVRALQYAREKIMLSERAAWADALRMLRQIERANEISILKRFGTHEDIRSFINECLGKYEENFVAQLYEFDVYSKEKMEALFKDMDVLYGQAGKKS